MMMTLCQTNSMLILLLAIVLPRTSLIEGFSPFRPTTVYTNLMQVDNTPPRHEDNHQGASYQNYYGANQEQQGVRYHQNPANALKSSFLIHFYCMKTSSNIFQMSVIGGSVTLYCIRNEEYLREVMFNNLPAQGMTESPFGKWVLAAKLLLDSGGYVPVCAVHCAHGSRPLVTPGNYTQPLNSSAFSVGCTNIVDTVCSPVCTDDIYQVNNGIVSCSLDTHVGSKCTVHCKQGYTNVGAESKSCGPDLAWDEEQNFMCLVDDVAYAVRNLMRYENLTADVALAELYSKLDEHLKNEPSTGQSSAEVEMTKVLETMLLSVAKSAPVTLKSLSLCAVRPNDRSDCGYAGITQEQCEARGCCWDDRIIGANWCFFKDGFRRANLTTKFTTKHPEYPYTTFLLQQELLRPPSRFPLEPKPQKAQLQPQHDFSTALPQDFGVESPGATEPSIQQCGCVAKNQVSRNLCIHSTPMARVFCGNADSSAKWPWHTIVFYGHHICGGTLISKDFIVTAAHCLEQKGVTDSDEQNRVIMGVTDRMRGLDAPNVQKRSMKRIIRHPLYHSRGDEFVQNDIALIQLSSPARLTDNVRILCLPGTRTPTIGEKCVITGFGKTDQSITPSILQSAKLPLVSVDQCAKIYNDQVNPVQNICAGELGKESPDACRGDSGGPLVCKAPGGTEQCSWYLAGITSFGKEPCGSGWPGVYVNVVHYQSWINSHIAGGVSGRSWF